MNPYYVLPDWSFNGPSRHDGFSVVCFANLTGLSQYPVFKVQAAADLPCVLRFCPLRATVCCFGGEEVHYAFASTVSTASRNFSRPCCSRGSCAQSSETNNASRLSRKALAGQHVYRVLAASVLLCDRLRTAFRFQHALRSPVGSGGAATKITTRPHGVQEHVRRLRYFEDCRS